MSAAVAAGVTIGMTIGLLYAPAAVAQDHADRVEAGTEAVPETVHIDDVADANARLESLHAEIATRQQAVNKTLVELQMARVALDDAVEGAAARSAERAEADRRVEDAESVLQDYSRQLYRQGISPGAATDLLDTTEPGTHGQRHEYLHRASADQREVVDELTESRDDAVAREADAEAALSEAEERHGEASELRDRAITEVDEVTAEVEGLESEVAALESQLSDARHTDGLADGITDGLADAPGADHEPSPDEIERAQNVSRALPAHNDLDEIRPFELYSGAAEGVGSVEGIIASIDAVQSGDVDAIVDQVMSTVMSANTGSISPSGGQSPPGNQNPGDPASAIERVIARGMTQIGVPYVWGGGDASGPTRGLNGSVSGFDCSGLMVYSFAGEGIALSKYSGDQYNAGRRVPISERKRGDLVFWGANGSQHVALYLGGGEMLEAQRSGVPVHVSQLRTSGLQPYAVRLIE